MNKPICPYISLGHYTYCSWEDYRNMKKIPTSEYLLMCCGPKKCKTKLFFLKKDIWSNFCSPFPTNKKDDDLLKFC